MKDHPTKNTDETTFVSLGEMEPEIIVGTDSTLIAPSIPVDNHIPRIVSIPDNALLKVQTQKRFKS